MSAEPSVSRVIGFWRTVGLLLRTAYRRSSGRMHRQKLLFQQRTGSETNTLSALGVLAMWAVMAMLNGFAAHVLHDSVVIAQKEEAKQQGKVIVSTYFINVVRAVENAESDDEKKAAEEKLESAYKIEALRRSYEHDQTKEEAEADLRHAVQIKRSRDFVDSRMAQPGFGSLAIYGPLPAMLVTLVLLWWLITLIFQGEGLELDLQRRRHPMWEWLFSHPVKPSAVFLAEMLSPVAANPIYTTAPMFFAVLFILTYSPEAGIAAAIFIGVPVAIATACVGKALEIGIVLRFPPRSRGALIGLMSWLGYAALMSFIFVAATINTVVPALVSLFRPFATLLPWRWVSWAIGLRPDGSLSFWSAVLFWWSVSAVMIAAGVRFTVWGAQRGLAGSSATKPVRPSKRVYRAPLLHKDPFNRKEILWFTRDRGAIVQAILVPVTIAFAQLLNLRSLARNANDSWQFLSGAAVIFGTYFLWVLGPRSLSSEGPALWLAQTWPRSLEELMKAKARLWFLLASGLVSLVLIFTLIRFPGDWWKVTLIAIGWFLFGRSMAAKSVTLVTAPSSSGEPEPVPKGRRWAASLGMLTFAVGILGEQWSLAVVGIVYSWVTAAAMWENFRARLPYLFDPWSEKLPPPPTLMHAMIAISALVEGGSVAAGAFMVIFARIGGGESMPILQALAFGVVAVVVWLVASTMLSNRGVRNNDVWCWRRSSAIKRWWWSGDGGHGVRFWASLSIGAVCGLLLAVFAVGYLFVLSRFEPFNRVFETAREHAENAPNVWTGLFIVAVGFAPFAEEYLFRGLLFRALDRVWGGWRAVLGSAAFFAIYHPPTSWLPVGLVGIASALVFKKTGRLAPSVILHMVYNAIVVGWAR